MKGVICSIMPSVRIVDISHEIRPQNIQEAVLLLEAAYPWFPVGTVHVVVVDPGVGTKRRAIAAQANGHLFVGPDNGVLSPALTSKHVAVHEILETTYELPERSDTFHGRDVFAPAAGHLASGLEIDKLGPPAENCVIIEVPRPVVEGKQIRGEVLRIDRFGNVLSNIPRTLLSEIGPGPYEVEVGPHKFDGIKRRYEDVPEGSALVLPGGDGRLEVAVNGGNASVALGLGVGDPFIVRSRS